MDGPLIVKLDKVVHYNLQQNRTKGQRGGSLYRVRPWGVWPSLIRPPWSLHATTDMFPSNTIYKTSSDQDLLNPQVEEKRGTSSKENESSASGWKGCGFEAVGNKNSLGRTTNSNSSSLLIDATTKGKRSSIKKAGHTWESLARDWNIFSGLS